MSDHLEPHEVELMSLFDRDLSTRERDRLFELLNNHPELSEKYAFYLHLQDLSLGELPPSDPVIKSRLMKHAARQTRAIRLQAWWHKFTAGLIHPAITGPAALCLIFLIGYEVFDSRNPEAESFVELSVEESINADEHSVESLGGELDITQRQTIVIGGAQPKDGSDNKIADVTTKNLASKATPPSPTTEINEIQGASLSRGKTSRKKKQPVRPLKATAAAKRKKRSKKVTKPKRQRLSNRKKKGQAKAVEHSKPRETISLEDTGAPQAAETDTKTALNAQLVAPRQGSRKGSSAGANLRAKSNADILFMGPATDDEEFEARKSEPAATLHSTPARMDRADISPTGEDALVVQELEPKAPPLSQTERRLLLKAKTNRNLESSESKFLLRVARLAFRAGDYESARKWTLWVIRRNDDQLRPALELQRKLITLERP